MDAIKDLIDQEIATLNDKVAKETASTWELNVLGQSYPLNMTMTKAPEVDGEIVKLNFDGLFDEPANQYGFKMDSHGYFPDYDAQKEQVWIHENTANTLLMDAIAAGYTMDFPAADLMPAFKEVSDAYPNATFSTKTTISPVNEGTPVRFTKANGVMLGNDKDLKLTMDLFADDKKIVEMGIVAMANMNFTMDKTITFFPKFSNVETFSAMVKSSEVPLKPGKLYTEIIEVYYNKQLQAFNDKYKNGIPVASLMPELGMISGVLRNATMNTQVADGWMFGGFSMQEDLTKFDQEYELKFLSN